MTNHAKDDVVFRAGVYELEFDSGRATVHVEHDVTAEQLVPAVRSIADHVRRPSRSLCAEGKWCR